MSHEVACAIADGGRAPATQVGQHQFASLAFLDGLAATRIEYLRDEFAFVDMDALLLRAHEAIGAHFSHARVVVGFRAPGALNAFASGGDRGSRFASMNGYTHTRLAHVHTVLLRYFRQAQGVAGRADQHGGPYSSSLSKGDIFFTRWSVLWTIPPAFSRPSRNIRLPTPANTSKPPAAVRTGTTPSKFPKIAPPEAPIKSDSV